MTSNKQGFTLVEILIALALGSIILASVYSAFQVQQKSAVVQDQVVVMQDNLRAAMDIMTREIRMAGYDPADSGNFGFQNLAGIGPTDYGRYTANDGISLYSDKGAGADEGNGTVENSGLEKVAFRLDVNDDGSAKDGTPGNERDYVLRKYSPSAVKWQPVAEDIEALEFNYILADGTETTAPGAGDLPNIRAVEISILARSERADPDFTNTLTYTTGSGAVWGAYNDNNRRRLLVKTVLCRNMGM